MAGSSRAWRRWFAPVALTMLLAMACTGDDAASPATTEGPVSTTAASSAPRATTSTGLAEVEGPFAPGRTQLPGFGEVQVEIVDGPDGEPIVLCVLLAETPAQRQRGLMEVTDTDLGGYDGMLFTYDADVDGGFWMKDTRMPLSVAYLDVRGAVVDTVDMEPCPESVEAGEGCPSHPPSGPFRHALEVAQGGLAPLGLVRGSEARLQLAGPCRST